MARKLPKLDHVKTVHAKGRVYYYFNTGVMKDDKPVYARLPDRSAPGFFDSYASFMAGRTRRAKTAYTVADLVRDYLGSPIFAKRAQSTQDSYRLHAGKVSEVWGKFPANELTPADVRLLIEGDTWKPGTAYMVLATVGVLYRYGRRNKGLTVDPAKDVERPEYGSHDPWPEDVLEAALASNDDTVRLAVHLLYFTGQRIGDVLAMRWGDIRHGYVTVKQAKTKKTVKPKLSAELAAELARTPRTGITIMHGVPEGQLRRRLQKFTADLGVKTVPHGLRKNAVNALLEAGCTVPEVAAITGQTHQVVEQYAAAVNSKMLGEAAVLKLDTARRNR